MEVILFETVPNLGGIGDRVKVKPGYARNYLIPQGKAVPATTENVAALEARRAELEKQASEVLSQAQATAQKLEGLCVTISRLAGEEGKLFGSVGTQDIVAAVADSGIEIARHDIQLPEGSLRNVGDYDIDIRLHSEVKVAIKVSVVPEQESE